jgi:hypothetical protein
MSRANKVCNHPGCVELIDNRARHCAEHVKEHRWQGTNTKRTSTAAHKRERATVLKRDGYQCQLRYEAVCIGTATELDHIDGWDTPGSTTIAVCRPCHARKSSMQGHAARGHNVTLPQSQKTTKPTTPCARPSAIPRTLGLDINDGE